MVANTDTMKYKLLLIALTTIFLFRCAIRNKITYNIPENYPAARKTQILDICEKGKVLYKTYCSECHGIFTKGKDKVPNFTNTQIDNYSVRFLRRDPGNHAVAMNMNPEQLNQVLTFLSYKRAKNPDSSKLYRKEQ